jgi:glycine oxidase
VIDLKKEDDRVVGVRTSDGIIACDAVVLATGPWVGETREWLGFDLPVTPVKGEMLRIRLQGAGLQYDFTRGMISLYRRGRDECWIGVTREQTGFDETPTDAGRRHLLEAAARIMPAVRQAVLLEHVASLRPMSASGLPLVGRVPGWSNAYITNGGGIKGMLLCTGVGLAISDMILSGDTGMPINMRISQGE